jgi:hypothetical protein
MLHRPPDPIGASFREREGAFGKGAAETEMHRRCRARFCGRHISRNGLKPDCAFIPLLGWPPPPVPHRQTCENTRQPAKFTARATWRQPTVGFQCCGRWTCASRVRPLQVFCTRFAPGSIGGLPAQRFRLRCKECARPATLPIVRSVWRRRGRVIDPTSANRNRCPPACREFDSDGGRSVAPHAHRSFIWQKSRATLCSWLALANPDYSAPPLPIRHLTIFTTTRDRRRVGPAGGAQGGVDQGAACEPYPAGDEASAFDSGCGGGAHGRCTSAG